MGTSSRIGIENEDGTITSIYCHWDGYVSHVGNILMNFYGDPAKIHELMKLGDLSCIDKEIGEKHNFNNHLDEHEDWCLAYGRDRGEEDTEAKLSKNFKEFEDLFEEYTYLFRDNQWFVFDYYNEETDTIKTMLVSEALSLEETS